MDCKSVQNNLIFYIEKSLPQQQMQQIQQHLKHCKPCAEKYQKLLTAYQFIETEKQANVNPFLWTRIQAKIQNKPAIQPIWQKVLQPVILTIIIVIGLFLGIKLGQLYTKPDNTIYYAQNINDTTLFYSVADIENEYLLFEP